MKIKTMAIMLTACGLLATETQAAPKKFNFRRCYNSEQCRQHNPNYPGGGSNPGEDTPTLADYTVSYDTVDVDSSNEHDVAFTISNAIMPATYTYTIADWNLKTPDLQGSGTITAATQHITGIDVSSLNDGVLTLTLTLTAQGETGPEATDSAYKNTSSPASLSLAITQGNPMLMNIVDGNSPSSDVILTVSNNGGGYSKEISTTLEGEVPHFNVEENTCEGIHLSTDDSCVIRLQAVSSGNSAYEGTLTITDTDDTIVQSLFGKALGFAPPDDGLVCWGRNSAGNLGVGFLSNIEAEYLPVKNLESGVSSMTTGGMNNCAIKSNGTVWCWGFNWLGAMGTGDTTTQYQTTSAQVPDFNGGATLVFTGGYGSAAAVVNNELYRWGQLYMNFGTPHPVPTLVPDFQGVTAGGNGMTECYIRNGNAYCGGQSQPELALVGDPLNDGNTADIQIGTNSICALKNDGSLWCWGSNSTGLLGADIGESVTSPRQIIASGVRRLSLGSQTACVIKTDNSLWCWGENMVGEVGNDSTTNQTAPVQIMAANTVLDVSVSHNQHTCAIKQDGSLWCWGLNDTKQLGNGTTTESHVPLQVPLFGSGNKHVYSIADATCVLRGAP